MNRTKPNIEGEEISCACDHYIVESERSFKDRISEHICYIKSKQTIQN